MRERDAMLTIGQVAQLAGTTVRTIRHYHQTGLLPEPPRGTNGYRRYRGSDLGRLHQIRQLSELGLALADIKHLVHGSVEDRRAALEMLRDQIADEERRLSNRRVKITELLASEGDPAVPTAFRTYLNSLNLIGAPQDLMALDAEIYRSSSGLMPPEEQQAVETAMTALGDDPALVEAIAGYMRRLEEVETLPPDHPELLVLVDDFVAFLQESWSDLTAVPGADPDPHLDWVMQDLLTERLSPTQVIVMRGVIDRLRSTNDIMATRSESTPPS